MLRGQFKKVLYGAGNETQALQATKKLIPDNYLDRGDLDAYL